MKHKIIFRFKIELFHTKPLIWRRIEVPSNYNFWQLHVAIQDAMGWLDYHLHSFYCSEPGSGNSTAIGLPPLDDFEKDNLIGWDTPLTQFFQNPGEQATYEYDFGDSWHHILTLEGLLLQEKRIKYPRCLDGAMACPPEDCGGIMGYEHLLDVLSDSKHEEYEDTIYWLKNHAKKYHPYYPEAFDPTKVKFSNPEKRFQRRFGDESVF